jgi:hypothetical protein
MVDSPAASANIYDHAAAKCKVPVINAQLNGKLRYGTCGLVSDERSTRPSCTDLPLIRCPKNKQCSEFDGIKMRTEEGKLISQVTRESIG